MAYPMSFLKFLTVSEIKHDAIFSAHDVTTFDMSFSVCYSVICHFITQLKNKFSWARLVYLGKNLGHRWLNVRLMSSAASSLFYKIMPHRACNSAGNFFCERRLVTLLRSG